MDVGGHPAFRCSGTLIAAKVVLTAGHCAGEPGEFSAIRIFAESDVQHDPTYPFSGGPNTFDAADWHAHPLFTERAFLRIRMFAEPHLIQIDGGIVGDFSLLLSNNASTGGTCFGDSGGPNYVGSSNVIAGVTSFGLNGTCGGTGGVFRLDRKNVLDFVGQYLK